MDVQPFQLSFLSPLPCVDVVTTSRAPKRRSSPRSLRESDVLAATEATTLRTPLRAPDGDFLPTRYTHDGAEVCVADPLIIIRSAEAIVRTRFRRGVRILKDPQLLLRFLKLRLVSQPQAVFAVFYLDRKQRLIRFEERFRGGIDDVRVHPGAIIRDALKYQAEQLICVRSDPTGNAEPTEWDIKDARALYEALALVDLPLVDYIIAGESVTSLRQLRVFQ